MPKNPHPSFLARLLRDREGSISVEAALVFPVLLLRLIGLTDLGLAVRHKMVLDGAARAGAQLALADADDLAAIEAVVLDAGSLTADSPPTIDVHHFCECSDGTAIACDASCAAGLERHRYVSISVANQHDTLFSYPMIANPLPLGGRAVFRLE
jgi:hypothetical protein